jgi:nucleotide-binding universal stress UspA family protein
MKHVTTKRTASRGRGSPLAKPFRSLLVPIDLTPGSDRVLGRVPFLPLSDDARVTILHVVPGSFGPEDRRLAERDAQKTLADEARHLRKSLPRHVRVEALVTHGAAAKVIVASANKAKADLIVMGRGGPRALRDAFLGSTAERVVRQSRLPVLVVRRPPRASYERPALALDVDVDQPAHEVVDLMLRVLPRPLPEVTVIHAFDVPYRGPVYPSLDDGTKAQCRLHATRRLGKLLATALADAGVAPDDAPSWKTHVRYGAPRLVVEKALGTTDADVLVVATCGHSGASYVLLGTIAGELLRAAPCDVLVVPPRPIKSHRAA